MADGARDEVAGTADLVGMALTVVSDPRQTAKQLKEFVTTLDWGKAGTLASGFAGGIIGLDPEELKKGFEKDSVTGKYKYPEYALHATGKVGGTLAVQAITGALIINIIEAPKKLGKKIDDIAAILNKLKAKLKTLGWDDIKINKFADDFNGNENLLKRFDLEPSNADALNPKAWDIMSDTKTKKLHPATLSKVTELLKDADFMGKLQGGEATLKDILKNAANQLDGNTASKLVNLSEHLENLKVVVKNHHDVPGFDKVITDLKISTFEKQDGISHTLNHMKELPAGKIEKVDYVFEPEINGGGLPCTNCRFDVQMKDIIPPPPGWVKYYEYKSYLKVQNIDINQFKNYISTIGSMDELKYIFNAKKLTTAQAKDGMKAFLKTNAPDLFKPISQGGVGLSKCQQLFGSDVLSPKDLIDKLNTQNSFDNILKFVETK